MKLINIVIPFLNEQDNIPVLYERLCTVAEKEKELFEFIFVDDGSTDSSSERVSDLAKKDDRVKLLSLSRNFGHQIAITAGLDHSKGDAVVIMDADLQDPPEVITDLLVKWRDDYQVVYAVRKSRDSETWLKKFLASFFYKIFKKLVSTDIPLNTGDFRLIDRKIVDALKDVRELHRFMRGLTCWVGYRQCAVYYDRAARHSGQTKYPIFKSMELALDALTSFSGKPLRWITGMGGFFALCGLIYMIISVVQRLLFPESFVPGWPSLIATILFIGGLQLFCLGLVGLYVSRIFEEVKRRPLYFLKND